jgi:hypothetical protein
VAIYRQWRLAGEQRQAGQVCAQGVSSTQRSTFMVGPDVFHAPSLTQSFPPGLDGQPGQLYYIDTSSSLQDTQCYPESIGFNHATFSKDKTYLIYHLFARNDATISYQFYVGDGVRNVGDVQGNFVRINPHLYDGVYSGNAAVTDVCRPGDTSSWCGKLPTPQIDEHGILTVTLDQRAIAADFNVAAREDYERCMPRDLCFYDADSKRCEACATTTEQKRKDNCIRQSDFLPADIASMNAPDGTGKNPLDVVRQTGYASGTTGDTVGDLSPDRLPEDRLPSVSPSRCRRASSATRAYNDKGATRRAASSAHWINDALVSRPDGADPLCPTPRGPCRATSAKTAPPRRPPSPRRRRCPPPARRRPEPTPSASPRHSPEPPTSAPARCRRRPRPAKLPAR